MRIKHRGRPFSIRRLTLTTMALIVCYCSPVLAAKRYTFVDLGVSPNGVRVSHASAINNLGQVVGSIDRPPSTNPPNAHSPTVVTTPFLWDQGEITDLPLPPNPRAYNSVVGINDAGQMVVATDSSGGARSYRFDGSTYTELPPPAGDFSHSYARDINATGQIVGLAQPGLTPPAVIWNDGVASILASLVSHPHGGKTAAINQAGKIVGASFNPMINSSRRATLWDDSVAVDLGALVGGNGYSEAKDVNHALQIVGVSSAANSQHHAFLWEDSVMVDLGVLPGRTYAEATAINDFGHVVGSSHGNNSHSEAFLWTPEEGMVTLSDFVDNLDAGLTLSVAVDINDSGQIVGTALDSAGQSHGFLLTPIPEPTSAAGLVVVSLTLLFGRGQAGGRVLQRPARSLGSNQSLSSVGECLMEDFVVCHHFQAALQSHDPHRFSQRHMDLT